MSKIPQFYISQTLLGFHPGPDLNRVFLQMPNDQEFILCEMGEPRSDKDVKRWHRLAEKLSSIWDKKDERPPWE